MYPFNELEGYGSKFTYELKSIINISVAQLLQFTNVRSENLYLKTLKLAFPTKNV